MLEIFALIFLTRHLASVADGKGYTKALAAAGPVFWIGGEFAGAIIAAVMGFDLGVYLGALMGAVAGGALGTAIVYALPGRKVADFDREIARDVGIADPEATRDNPFAATGA